VREVDVRGEQAQRETHATGQPYEAPDLRPLGGVAERTLTGGCYYGIGGGRSGSSTDPFCNVAITQTSV
jgi:hypothetical protein